MSSPALGKPGLFWNCRVPERAIASGNMGDIPEAIGAVFLQSKLQGMHPGLTKF